MFLSDSGTMAWIRKISRYLLYFLFDFWLLFNKWITNVIFADPNLLKHGRPTISSVSTSNIDSKEAQECIEDSK